LKNKWVEKNILSYDSIVENIEMVEPGLSQNLKRSLLAANIPQIIVNILVRNSTNQYWPDPLKTNHARSQNKDKIEKLKCKF
jgi:hypothetical protein